MIRKRRDPKQTPTSSSSSSARLDAIDDCEPTELIELLLGYRCRLDRPASGATGGAEQKSALHTKTRVGHAVQ